MSALTLSITTQRRFPDDLKALWEKEVARHGFNVEINPDNNDPTWKPFTPETWDGGWLAISVATVPADLTGFTLTEPIHSGFELAFHGDDDEFQADLESPLRSVVDTAMLFFGAATLTKVSGGRYTDGYDDLDAKAALAAAFKEVKARVDADLVESDHGGATADIPKIWKSRKSNSLKEQSDTIPEWQKRMMDENAESSRRLAEKERFLERNPTNLNAASGVANSLQ